MLLTERSNDLDYSATNVLNWLYGNGDTLILNERYPTSLVESSIHQEGAQYLNLNCGWCQMLLLEEESLDMDAFIEWWYQ